MKLLIAMVLFAVAFARPGDYYDPKYDNFNVDELISNDRLLSAYAHCFIGDGKCTPEGTDFSGWIPEGVSSSCGKCTEKQKTLVAKTVNAIKEKLPTEYDILIKKNDPENKFQDNLKNFLAQYSA